MPGQPRLSICRGILWSPRLWCIFWPCLAREQASLVRVVYIALTANTAGVSVNLPPVFLEMPRANHVVTMPLRHVYEVAAKRDGSMFAAVAAHNPAHVTITNIVSEELGPLINFVLLFRPMS